MSPGDFISDGETVGGIRFNYPTLAGYGLSMMITDYHELGIDDGDAFQDGDDFNLSFVASNAIGMYFISGDEMWNEDITLSVGSYAVDLNTGISVDLGDDYYAYFLGIIDPDTTFMTADIITSTGVNGVFLYTVDDITLASSGASSVPEPTTLILLGSGLLGLAGARRRFRK
jgi:hypothetical protein